MAKRTVQAYPPPAKATAEAAKATTAYPPQAKVAKATAQTAQPTPPKVPHVTPPLLPAPALELIPIQIPILKIITPLTLSSELAAAAAAAVLTSDDDGADDQNGATGDFGAVGAAAAGPYYSDDDGADDQNGVTGDLGGAFPEPAAASPAVVAPLAVPPVASLMTMASTTEDKQATACSSCGSEGHLVAARPHLRPELLKAATCSVGHRSIIYSCPGLVR